MILDIDGKVFEHKDQNTLILQWRCQTMFRLLETVWKRFVTAFQSSQEFQQRIWVVSIQNGSEQKKSVFNDTYLINEDSFDTPMHWMNNKGYSAESIKKVDKMQRSQVLTVELENYRHSLMRVK